jgi:uncharacterized protein YndB with AHSA1/START domain
MKSYAATAMIEASPEAIWAILTDAPDYNQWDSGVERVDGRIAPGERIKVVSKANPGRAFPVTVTEFAPAQRIRRRAGYPWAYSRVFAPSSCHHRGMARPSSP